MAQYRFSMRFMFVLVTLAAVAAMVIAVLVRAGVGTDLSVMTLVALVGLACIAVVHGLLFLLAALVNRSRADRPPMLLLAMALVLVADVASAQPGSRGRRPKTPPKPNVMASAGGIDVLKIETWFDHSGGYRPIRVTAAAAPPPAGDRPLTLRFREEAWGYRGRTFEEQTTQPVVLAPQTTPQHWSSLLPPFSREGSIEIDILEDGRPIQDLTAFHSASSRNWSNNAQNYSPGMLWLSGAKWTSVDTDSLESAWEQQFPTPSGRGPKQSNFRALPAAEAPLRWIEYSSVDLVGIAWEDLQAMAQRQPRQWDALRRWVSTGGNMIIVGLGDKWQQLEQVAPFLGLAAPSGKADADWSVATFLPESNPDSLPPVDEDLYDYEFGPPRRNKNRRATVDPFQQNRALSDLNSFRNAKLLGLGRVIPVKHSFQQRSFQSPENSRGRASNIQTSVQTLQSLLPADRLHWYHRHGLPAISSNPVSRMFMVPGVGQAPVNAFMFLVTAFAIVVGPVSYYVFQRKKRLHWLLISVPLFAIVTTVSLFAYGSLIDGFSVRVRARSLSYIDQRSGDAATWARLSYYSGRSVGDGLRFSNDTAVYPLDFDSGATGGSRVVHWGDDQHLASGFLPPRTVTQFVTVRSRKSTARLPVDEQPASLRVANELGTTVRHLVVFDSQGRPWEGSDLAPAARQELKRVDDLTTFHKTLHESYLSKFDQAEIARFADDDGMFDRRRYSRKMDKGSAEYYYSMGDNEGLLEDLLKPDLLLPPGSIPSTVKPPETNSPDKSEAKNDAAAENQPADAEDSSRQGTVARAKKGFAGPRTYIAIVERSPEVEFGVEAHEEASYHVIVGRW